MYKYICMLTIKTCVYIYIHTIHNAHTHSASMFNAFLPEVAGREFLSNDDSASFHDHLADSDDGGT